MPLDVLRAAPLLRSTITNTSRIATMTTSPPMATRTGPPNPPAAITGSVMYADVRVIMSIPFAQPLSKMSAGAYLEAEFYVAKPHHITGMHFDFLIRDQRFVVQGCPPDCLHILHIQFPLPVTHAR